MKLPGYVTYTRNRVDKASGGISTSVIDDDASNCIRVEEGSDDNEFIVTRHSKFATPVNIINMYGQQECRMSKESIEKHWNDILEVIGRIEERDELTVVIGDLNRHLGSEIPGNSSKVSYGGELVNEFLESGKYVLVNSTEKVKEGPGLGRIHPTKRTSLCWTSLLYHRNLNNTLNPWKSITKEQ